nr:MAG TPA: hypothetical protein [Caudoviricetes sp.]
MYLSVVPISKFVEFFRLIDFWLLFSYPCVTGHCHA